MHYNIVALGDIHWGCLDANKQFSELQIITEYLETHDVDLVVICGDYFDHKLLLNSQASLMSVEFMNNLRVLSKNEKHPFKIRIFDGTHSHDHNQLEVFRPFDDGDTFRVFRNTTCEETLPGLQCLYAPDETLTNDDYFKTYGEILHLQYDIMFFHGSFDVQLGDLLKDTQAKNVVFEYDYFSQIAQVMIGGHWHDADHYENVYYTRSVNRWMFGEDNPKGFITCDYNTETKSYEIKRVNNPYTDRYVTFIVDTSLYTDIDKYNSLITLISSEIDNDEDVHIKIKVNITNDDEQNKIYIDNLRYKYSNTRQVKLVIENKVTKKKRKEKSESHSVEKDTYAFLFKPETSLCDKIKEFVRITKGIELDEWQTKYLSELFKKYIDVK